jgi:NAD(P)-dependent dehydrogenase (short-subunit alcohol dehydrogenase family)
VFAVNVDGLLNVTRAVLPAMRRQRSGRIINISSMAGFTAWAGWGVYAATKFAVEGLSEALDAELRPLGIRVTIIEPGRFRTDFLDERSLQRAEQVIADYSATAVAARQRVAATHHRQPGDPAKGASVIVSLGESPDPPLRLPLGADAMAAVEAKLAQVAGELAAWREVTRSTGY